MQSRSTDDGFQKVSEFSWAFFKNAFSVYDDIMSSEPSILGLQVLLAMAAYLGRTTDLRMAMLLSSTCVHMARLLGLDKESHIVGMPQAESEQRKRLIWIVFVLDAFIRIKANQPLILSAGCIEAGIPDQASADRLGYFKISGTEQSVNVFDLMIKITAIRSEIYSYLNISTKQALRSPEAQDFILSMQGRVSTWTMELPIDYRPEEKVAKAAVMGEQSTHYEAVRFLFSCSPGHRLLAQALLTNLPKLDAVCQAASANLFAQSEQRPRNTPLLAPDCMVPSTYNFGPNPSDTSLVDTMRAVYSDVVA
ncbi:hypothetical protein D6D15_02958 [Aureobasidium pullulans]|uniref:Xylanolytic transcriptional activator regulatory domain-containing protein n=1 Tax=Aureobasidium pullulans TaxID=5580 RepID=A0A4V4IWC0_AURPU|nr:hypothetical protein D6D15_02958 [Aureobasidium pullulans]